VLREQHQMLGTTYREIRAEGEAGSMVYEAISYMATELTRFMAVHDNVLLLELGLEDLDSNKLGCWTTF
jgi:hypothetical protein